MIYYIVSHIHNALLSLPGWLRKDNKCLNHTMNKCIPATTAVSFVVWLWSIIVWHLDLHRHHFYCICQLKFLDNEDCVKHANRPISQIPECICAISHNAPIYNRNMHICAHFCYQMVHCGIFFCCIVGFVRWAYSTTNHDKRVTVCPSLLSNRALCKGHGRFPVWGAPLQ